MNIQNMIGRYAQILATVERDTANGKQPDPRLLNEGNRLYARASAMLTPQEAQQALAAVESMKAQHHHNYEVQAAQNEARDNEYYTHKMAKNLTDGQLGADQLAQVLKEGKYAVKGASKAPNRDRVDRQIRQMTQALGQKDMGLEAFDKVALHVEELQLAGRDPSDYLKRKFGDNARQATAMLKGWDSSGTSMALALHEKRGGSAPDELIDADEDTIRRAQLADAVVRDALHDESARNDLIDDSVPDDWLESDGMHGDIARAWAATDDENEREERENFSTPTYDIQEAG